MPNSCAQHISHAGTTNWGGTAAGRTREALLCSSALQKSGQSDQCSCPRLHHHLNFVEQSGGHGREEYEQPPHCTVGAGVQQLGCARQQLNLHPAQLARGVPATRTATSDRACALQCPLCDPEPRQRPLTPTEQLCTAHKNTVRVRTVRPFWRAAVSRALRSQFWADFAETEICHGARARR